MAKFEWANSTGTKVIIRKDTILRIASRQPGQDHRMWKADQDYTGTYRYDKTIWASVIVIRGIGKFYSGPQ